MGRRLDRMDDSRAITCHLRRRPRCGAACRTGPYAWLACHGHRLASVGCSAAEFSAGRSIDLLPRRSRMPPPSICPPMPPPWSWPTIFTATPQYWPSFCAIRVLTLESWARANAPLASWLPPGRAEDEDNIYSPVGLDIGAENPEQIAACHRRRNPGCRRRPRGSIVA